MAGKTPLAVAIGIDDAPVDFQVLVLHPGKQGRAEIEADLGVVIDDFTNVGVYIQDSRCAVGRITLGGYAFIPIVIGIGRFLIFNGFQPGILTWRLVEMGVNADVVVLVHDRVRTNRMKIAAPVVPDVFVNLQANDREL